MKYLSTLSLWLILSLPSCNPQGTSSNTSKSKVLITKERSDSLLLKVPQPQGFINDFTQLFTNQEIRTLDSLVVAFEKATTVEISVATVSSAMVIKEDFEDYTLVMFNKWGVGKKEKNNGILLVISPEQHQIRIQNGYGMEGVISDTETKQIIDNTIIPRFREGKYFDGTREGIIAIIKKLQEKGL